MMETFWTVGVVAALGANAILLVLALGLSRELGLVLVRLGPQQARAAQIGPAVGSMLPDMEISSINGQVRAFAAQGAVKHVIVFIAPACNVCVELVPEIARFARSYASSAEVSVVALSAPTDVDSGVAASLQAAGVFLSADRVLAATLGIHSAPFALLVDGDGVVWTSGIINSLTHIESLIDTETFSDLRAQGRTTHATST